MSISAGLGGTVGAVPVGSVTAFAGATAPAGWLLCYGQTVSRTLYSGLFLTIGTAYGAGDGSTTFALPDLRGRVPAGLDNMGGVAANRLTSTVLTESNTLGATGGTQTHTLTDAQVPATELRAFDGSFNYRMNSRTEGSNGGYYLRPGTEMPNSFGSGSYPIFVGGGGGAHLNTQPTIVLNYIIRAQ